MLLKLKYWKDRTEENDKIGCKNVANGIDSSNTDVKLDSIATRRDLPAFNPKIKQFRAFIYQTVRVLFGRLTNFLNIIW